MTGSQAGVLDGYAVVVGACLVIGFIFGYMFGRVPPPWGNA